MFELLLLDDSRPTNSFESSIGTDLLMQDVFLTAVSVIVGYRFYEICWLFQFFLTDLCANRVQL